MDLTLNTIKKHCNIDEWFKDDDIYLLELSEVAQQVVQRDLDTSFESLKSTYGKIPDAIIHACLLFIGNCYANREAASVAALHPVPLSYQYLLDLYRNYSSKTSEPCK